MISVRKPRGLRWVGLTFGPIVISLLAGCGGGGGGSGATTPVTNADPTGYYSVSGTATVEDNSSGTVNITDMEAMASNNHIIMISAQNGFQYDVSITNITGNSFTGNVTIFYTPSTTQFKRTSTISGTITQGSSITGNIAGPGLGSGNFDLLYSNQTNQLSSTTTGWGTHFGGSSTYYNILIANATDITTQTTTNDGLFASCIMNGKASYSNSGSLYSVTLTMSSCATPSIDGNYTGFLAPHDASLVALAFAVTKSDSSYGFGTVFLQ